MWTAGTWRSRRFWRRVIVVGGLLMVGLMSGLALLGTVLARAVPTWWSPARADDPAVRASAEAIENGVVNQLHAWRPPEASTRAPTKTAWRSEPWTVSLEASDANAWLAAALPKWLANQERPARLPSELSELQVAFASGVIRVGVKLELDGRPHLLSASVRPEMHADGTLWLPATWVRIGRMPVPASWLLDQALDPRGELAATVMKSPEARAAARVLAGLDPVGAAPEVRLADGRRVRLLKIEPREGQLWLTCRTEGHP